MEKRPVAAFVVLTTFGSLCLVSGIELIDPSGTNTTFDQAVNLWIPVALVIAGAIMMLAAWRLLRFALLGSAMILGGMTFMWAAPSLRPVAGTVLGGAFRFLWALLEGEPWRVAGRHFLRQVIAAFEATPPSGFRVHARRCPLRRGRARAGSARR